MINTRNTIKPETLSALNTLYSECNKGPIQVLTPFFVNVIYESEITSISAETHPRIKALLKEKLGLEIPIHAVTSIANEAARECYLIRSREYGPLILNKQKAEENNRVFLEMERNSGRKWAKLIDGFIEFFKEEGYGDISEKQADAAILDFIKISSSDVALGTEGNIDDSAADGESSTYQDLSRVAMYVSAMSKDPYDENYEYLVNICFGNSLASAVFWWDDDANASHLRDLDVYLDSPIVFRLLGFDDEGHQDAAIDLASTLSSRGAHLMVFEHVLSEVIDIFQSTKCWIGNPNYDPSKASKTAQRVIELGLSPVEVEKIIADIPDQLEHLDIERKEAVSVNESKDHWIDEAELHKKISDTYAKKDRDMYTTIQTDVKSIGCINRLRNGETIVHLNKAKAVLCTSNRTLTRVSFEFECSEYDRPDRSIPLCMLDASLATIAWLESPGKGKRIAQKRIIAQTNGLIGLTAAVKGKFCADLKSRREAGLISNAEYLAIVRESTINKMLAKRTGNNPDLYTGETLDEVINQWIDERTIRKNRQIQDLDKTIATQSEEIAGYRAKEERRAARWGHYAVAFFVALITLASSLIGLAFPSYPVLVVGSLIFGSVATAAFNEKIRNFGFSLYQKTNPQTIN